ncbi:serine/threonine protein kinase [Amycolatopsis sp. NPDC049868]|uniref:serine/threonine protein kinase n=1 Tax=Amycolatopsis sp. NPDC049868 TaxID=3363934 RepID=UPI0037898F99
MNRAGSIWFWSLLGAFIAAALGTAINFATDLKTNFLAWGLVVAFTLATGLISGISQVLIRGGDGTKTTGTTNVYNVRHSQVNAWLVFLILGVSGSVLAAIFVGVHFAKSFQTAGTPIPAVAEPSPSTSTTTISTTTSTTSTAPQPATNEDIAQFVTAYYRLMPDTRAGWPLIGPNLQRRGQSDYEAHWGRISAVDVHSASATSATTVRVRITLHYRDGRPSPTETHELTVVPYDGRLRIDADTLIRAK